MVRKVTLFVAGIALVLAAPAFGDWDPEQAAKWVQFPDLSPMGIDVNATQEYILADDFLCDTHGPITDIHIWGSWLYDELPGDPPDPNNVTFTLSIHRDIPSNGTPAGYSMPGDVLWYRTFYPGEFTARIWASDIEEGWLDPPDYYFFPADWTCWQYNFFIPEADAFIQEGTTDQPIVYWLDVQAVPNDLSTRFGWKTSLDHWNDDAVWGQGQEPYPGPWQELRYPPQHEMYGQSIDLAFVITTKEEELDFGDAPDPLYPTLLMNDGARHMITGNWPWLGDLTDAPDSEPDGQPDPNATGDDLDIFYPPVNDDEDGVMIPPMTVGVPATIVVEVSGGGAGGFVDAWIDFDGNGTWDAAEQILSGFMPDGFNNIIVIAPGPFTGQTFARFRISTAGGLAPNGLAQDGEVEDYEVFIEEEPKPDTFLFEFSLDIGSDIELSDPFVDGDEAADPGDVYWWRSAPIVPPGRDGFKDDEFIFGPIGFGDVSPNPPDPFVPPMTAVPVGDNANYPPYVPEYFDLDGHDQIDFSLIEYEIPYNPVEIPQDQLPVSQCIYSPEFLVISMDDDMADGWPVFDVPVMVPSPAGMIYGTTPGMDEIMAMILGPVALPPYPVVVGPVGIADERSVHDSLKPNPDFGDDEDDDVDSLDIVCSEEQCPYWYFTSDHEAPGPGPMVPGILDPGDIYEVTAGGPVLVIDGQMNLGLPDGTDVDAFEFAWIQHAAGGTVLAVLFSVDDDDLLTAVNESGFLNPNMIYYSVLNGSNWPLIDTDLFDDVDALTIWHSELPDINRPYIVGDWKSWGYHGPNVENGGWLYISCPQSGTPGIETREAGIVKLSCAFSEQIVLPLVTDVVLLGCTHGPYNPISVSLDGTGTVLTMDWGNIPNGGPNGLGVADDYAVCLYNITDLASNPLTGDTNVEILGHFGNVQTFPPLFTGRKTNGPDVVLTKGNFTAPGAYVTQAAGNAKFDVQDFPPMFTQGKVNGPDVTYLQGNFQDIPAGCTGPPTCPP